jgi:hypothetical protein
MEWLFYIVVIAICGASAIVANNARSHARLALRESKRAVAAKDEAEYALVSILDEDGNVRGRLALPGEVPEPPPPPPTTTPCGDLCKHSWFAADGGMKGNAVTGDWLCKANQGLPCDRARPKFLDKETNNCVMFERDDD